MFKLRMADEVDLAGDRDAFMLGLDAVEFYAAVGRYRRDAGKPAKEIEMPPGAAEFAVGGKLQAHFGLFLDDGFDLAVFDGLERLGADFAFGEFGARIFERGGRSRLPT